MDSNNTSKISIRSFIVAFAILLAMMIFVGVMTRVIPAGEYERQIVDGREVIVNDSLNILNRINCQYTNGSPHLLRYWAALMD